MKPTLVLLVIPVLLLAGSARADDAEDARLEAEIARVEAQIVDVSEKARAAQDEDEQKELSTEVQRLHAVMATLQDEKERRRVRRMQRADAATAAAAKRQDLTLRVGFLVRELAREEDPERKAVLKATLAAVRAELPDLEASTIAGNAREAARKALGERLGTEGRRAYDHARAKHEALQTKYAELQAQIQELRQVYGDQHPNLRRARSQLERVSEEIAILEKARQNLERALRRWRVSDYEVARKAFEEALDLAKRAGVPTAEPPSWPQPPAPPPAGASDRPFESGGGRIDHLRAAARHLRQAGADEQATAVEREIRKLEQARAGPADVHAAVRSLTEEVRDLRRQVREIKDLLLERKKR